MRLRRSQRTPRGDPEPRVFLFSRGADAPLCLSAPRAEAESINGVLLTRDLAKELRAAIARMQIEGVAAGRQ